MIVPYGSRSIIELSDNSVIWLNSPELAPELSVQGLPWDSYQLINFFYMNRMRFVILSKLS